MKVLVNLHKTSNYSVVFVILILISLTGCGRKNSENGSVLARVGDKTISVKDFAAKFVRFTAKRGLPKNGEARKNFLKNLIKNQLLVLEAKKEGLGHDDLGRQEYQRIKIQKLLNLYNTKVIGSRVKISENELKTLFVKLHTKIKAQHLYAPTRRKADSLFNLVHSGVSFRQLAKDTFRDPKLKYSGGSIGYFTVGDVDPNFEDVAYSLNIGEISRPVKTAMGYSIIKVDDRFTDPLLTETEYAKSRSRLVPYLRHRKTMKATQQLVDSLRIYLKISYNKPVLKKFFAMLQEKSKDKFTLNEIKNPGYPEKIKSQVLLHFRGSRWTVSNFQEAAKFTSASEQHWIRNLDTFQEFINGLVVRNYILKECKKLKLDETPEYKNSVNVEWENYLQSRMEEKIYAGIRVPEDSIATYYKENLDKFRVPPQFHVREIILEKIEYSKRILRLLRKGASFSRLADQFSIQRREIGNGGDAGYLTAQKLGPLYEIVRSMKPGQWRGPFKLNSKYLFIKLEDKIQSRQKSLSESRVEIIQTLKNMWYQKARDQEISIIRKNIPVFSYPERLLKISLN